MNQLNRQIAPETVKINNLKFPVCERITGNNGVPIYYTRSQTAEVLRIEFVFDAGIARQSQKALATAANALLSEGTRLRTAEQIADGLDFYGSYLNPRCAVDDAQITFYCLKKHLSRCLEIVSDVIKEAQYPENELSIYVNNNKQRLRVQQQKTSYLCRRAYYESIFGGQSPISSYSESGDYDKISRETLINFHQNHYATTLKYITISGDIDDVVLTQLSEFCGDFKPVSAPVTYQSDVIANDAFIKKGGSVQSTLRIGRRLINRRHPDYRKLQLLNMILGGYFGSRLMKNIREDKGLTYGIYSVMESYLDDGCFYIEADVNSKKAEIAVKEIYHEIDKLNNDLIDEKELTTARNYFIGSILRSIDGPFTIMDRNRIIIDYGFADTYYEELLDTINTTTSIELRTLSNQYFKRENLVETICGG